MLRLDRIMLMSHKIDYSLMLLKYDLYCLHHFKISFDH